MTPRDRQMAVILADQDQDYMNALAWWREHSEEAKIEVMVSMTSPPDQMRTADDDILETISRFAIIGFTEVYLRHNAEAGERSESP